MRLSSSLSTPLLRQLAVGWAELVDSQCPRAVWRPLQVPLSQTTWPWGHGKPEVTDRMFLRRAYMLRGAR
ncbi:hypothetical protein VTK73DRAFT_3572 [Phialemonium thermophilum]|uniref:Uncharacterized protein n=1 Tax=Phialemonium thermophilum TaxID=223376 RepID=A0ABR3WY97_9PEZI